VNDNFINKKLILNKPFKMMMSMRDNWEFTTAENARKKLEKDLDQVNIA
jgi:NADPH-dependent 7-cyano-7-deazaguanine reductase QueF-like protein